MDWINALVDRSLGWESALVVVAAMTLLLWLTLFVVLGIGIYRRLKGRRVAQQRARLEGQSLESSQRRTRDEGLRMAADVKDLEASVRKQEAALRAIEAADRKREGELSDLRRHVAKIESTLPLQPDPLSPKTAGALPDSPGESAGTLAHVESPRSDGSEYDITPRVLDFCSGHLEFEVLAREAVERGLLVAAPGKTEETRFELDSGDRDNSLAAVQQQPGSTSYFVVVREASPFNDFAWADLFPAPAPGARSRVLVRSIEPARIDIKTRKVLKPGRTEPVGG